MRRRRLKQSEHDLDCEIRSHLELEAHEQQQAGLPPDQARYAELLGRTCTSGIRPRWGTKACHRQIGEDAICRRRSRGAIGRRASERSLFKPQPVNAEASAV
jgi:hypothetical protein